MLISNIFLENTMNNLHWSKRVCSRRSLLLGIFPNLGAVFDVVGLGGDAIVPVTNSRTIIIVSRIVVIMPCPHLSLFFSPVCAGYVSLLLVSLALAKSQGATF